MLAEKIERFVLIQEASTRSRIHAALQDEGIPAGKKRAARLMKEAGLNGKKANEKVPLRGFKERRLAPLLTR